MEQHGGGGDENEARKRDFACYRGVHDSAHENCGRAAFICDTPSKLCGWCIVLVTTCIVVAAVVTASWLYIPYTHWGIAYNRETRERAGGVLEGGAYLYGPSWRALLVPRTAMTIERTGQGALSVRALDGQRVSLDLSMTFIVPRETAVKVYDQYQGDPSPRIQGALLARLLNVASRYETENFFSLRVEIVGEMEVEAKKVTKEHGTELLDFQIRRITIPDEIDTRLKSIELNKVITNRREKELVLNATTVHTERLVAASRFGRVNDRARSELDIEHSRLVIEAKQRAEEDLEVQEVAAIEARTDKELEIVHQELSNALEQIQAEEDEITQETSRLVAAIYSQGNRTLSLLQADTQRNVSQVEVNVTLVEKETAQAVAKARATAERILDEALAFSLQTKAEAEAVATEAQRLALATEATARSQVDQANIQTLANHGFNGSHIAALAFVRALDQVQHVSAADIDSPLLSS